VHRSRGQFLWIERSEQTRKQPDEMSDAEIAAILKGQRELM
jgi:hypothetical protein